MFHFIRTRKPRQRRKFAPAVDGLEMRQLLSSQTLYGNDASLAISITGGQNTTPVGAPGTTPLSPLVDALNSATSTSSGGSSLIPNPTASFTASVGSGFSLSVQTNPGVFLSEVDYSTPHCLSSTSTFSDFGNSYVEMDAKSDAGLNPSVTSDYVKGYLDETVTASGAPTELAVVVQYRAINGGQAPPPDRFDIEISTVAPTGNINAQFSGASGPQAWGLGPIAQETYHQGWTDTDGTPTARWHVDWNDPNYTSSKSSLPSGAGYATNYGFGIGGSYNAPRDTMDYTISLNNTTPTDGEYVVQQYIAGSTRIDYGLLENPLTGNPFTPYSTPPNETNGWEVDTIPATANNPGTTVHAPVAVGASVSNVQNPAFMDDPSTKIYAGTDTFEFAYHVDYKSTFQTELLWRPTGGIPIVVAMQPWDVFASFDNPDAMDIMKNATGAVDTAALWKTTYGTEVNWEPTPNDPQNPNLGGEPGLSYGDVSHAVTRPPNATGNATVGLDEPDVLSSWTLNDWTGGGSSGDWSPIPVVQTGTQTGTITSTSTGTQTSTGTGTQTSTGTSTDTSTTTTPGIATPQQLASEGQPATIAPPATVAPPPVTAPLAAGGQQFLSSIPQGAIGYWDGSGNEHLWYDSWGPFPGGPDMSLTPPAKTTPPASTTPPSTTQTVQSTPTAAQPAPPAVDIEDPNAADTTSSDDSTILPGAGNNNAPTSTTPPSSTTNDGTTLPGAGNNNSPLSSATDPTDTADHPADAGWVYVTNNGHGHWWDTVDGTGYVDGDSII